MDRANPVDLRKAIAAANELTKAGILFVPMPVLDDHADLLGQLGERLKKMEDEAEC